MGINNMTGIASLDGIITKALAERGVSKKSQKGSVPRLVEDKIRRIDKKEALSLLKKNRYRGQRPLSLKRLLYLIDKQVNDLHYGADLAIAKLIGFDSEEVTIDTGEKCDEILINGQHSLAVIYVTGKPANCRVRVFECKNEDELAVAYAQQDPPGQNRSKQQHVKAFLGIINENLSEGEDEWNAREASIISSACALADSGNFEAIRSATEYPLENRIHLMCSEEYSEHAIFAWESIKTVPSAKKKRILREPVMAAMILHHREYPEECEDFWKKVCTGLNIKDKNEPANKLAEWLDGVSIQSSGNSVVAEQVAEVCSLMFIKHLEQTSVERVRTPKTPSRTQWSTMILNKKKKK